MNKTLLLSIVILVAFTSWYSYQPISNTNKSAENSSKKKTQQLSRLKVSQTNPHLLETVKGKPVFLNNYTAWVLIENGTKEDIAEFMHQCKEYNFNMVSCVIFNDNYNGSSKYNLPAFALDASGNPDPLTPVVTPGKDINTPGQYDYWDHVEYVIKQATLNGMYITLHPTWGYWVSGKYSGPSKGDKIIFNVNNAYQYGFWLGQRFGKASNLVWMLGGDRSAVYGKHDFRDVWRAMAEGLADGTNGENNQNGHADYSDMLISFHPRKWASNSSEWFHNDEWLTFNSIQDTPYDQTISLPNDYNLKPVKPTWLFEGRYEGATSPWAIRYQAYQTVFAGGFGCTYGSDNCQFPDNWRELVDLPGSLQMAYLYSVSRKIWTDRQYFNRTPDQSLIVGDTGDTKGDGMTVGDGDGGSNAKQKGEATSDKLTAIRDNDGKWAMVYSANGRDFTLDLSKLSSGKKSAFWFNPRTGVWTKEDQSFERQTPFLKGLKTGVGKHLFNPPGTPGPNNDWVLILK